MITKICNICHEEKTIDKFPKCKTCKDGHNHYCRKCKKKKPSEIKYRAIYEKKCYKKNYKKRRYGLLQEDYDKMILSQNNRCLICKSEKPLNIDHCHISGKVRGLLCASCNCGLGFFKDNINILNNAVEYLKTKTPAILSESR
jgi:hypothetical protein